jgi:hypothetical protein
MRLLALRLWGSADLGNDSLPDAVVKHLRNDALRSDIFSGFDRRLPPRRPPKT